MTNSFISREKLKTNLILILVLASWVIYPFVMIYFLARAPIQMAFGGLFAGGAFLLFIVKTPKLPRLTPLHYLILVLWALYLYFFLFASLRSEYPSALGFFFNFFIKVAFFVVLLMYLEYNLIYKTFKIYAELMLVCTILALIVVVGVAFGLMHPIYLLKTTIATGTTFTVKYYLGAVYEYAPVTAPFPLYRLQSFAGEPGSYAMVVAPALYWFLFVDKNRVKAGTIIAGIIGSFSVGIAICFLLLIILVTFQKKIYFQRMALAFLLLMVTSPLLFYVVSSISPDTWVSRYLLSKFITGGEASSFGSRVVEIEKTVVYLGDHSIGSGAGVGMTAVKFPISNGYVKAFLEAGYLGGVFYVLLFLAMAVLAYRVIKLSGKSNLYPNVLGFVLGLSALTVMFMGLQRDQPDLSFWHMWLYASLFVADSGRSWRIEDAAS